MPLACDVIIAGGTVVDGTGRPGFLADVAITGPTITAIGPNLQRQFVSERVVDATGHIVTPGFVDIHTHYDGQVTWDPLLTPSSGHGVTTLMFGNCGIGFAPCRPLDRTQLIDILVSVEDIPGTALHAGIRWDWTTFPEYLDSLSRTETACDFLAMVGHVPIRVFAMGKRASETPTPADLVTIRGLVAEAVRAGAAGFSTSRTLMHRDLAGEVIAGSYANRDELTAIFAGIADGGGGLFEILEDFADVEKEMGWIGALSKAFGVPVSFAFGAHSAEDQRKLLSWMERINRDNVLITGQAAIRNQGCLQSLRSKYHPLAGHRTFVTELAGLPYAEMIARMRTAEVRRQILAEGSFFDDKPFANVIFNPANLYPLMDAGGVPRYERSSETESFEALADAAGVEDPLALIYDALVDEQLLWAPLTGTASERRLLDLITHPHVRVGLGDGGAHLGIFQEAGCPTYMLSHYARDRTRGRRLAIEHAVKMQTSDTAAVVGLRDRGRLEVGLRADVNVIDMATLTLHPPRIVHDLPTGASRWIQTATGYRMTMVAGVPTYEHSAPTGLLPGRLVRHPLAAPGVLNLRRLDQIDPAELTGPEPRSTNDLIVKDADLAGGGSAIKRAMEANRAAMIGQVGEFLSGELLRGGQRADRPTGTSKL